MGTEGSWREGGAVLVHDDGRPGRPAPPLSLGFYQGSLSDLASRLKRRTLPALGISATLLIQQLRQHWRMVDGVDRIAEEMPVAAWVLGRKMRELLAEREEDPEDEDVLDGRPWVQAAVASLRTTTAHQDPVMPGPPRWPVPGWPPIRDAHAWRLPLMWPPRRAQPQARPSAAVVAPDPPLWRRALLLLRRIRRSPDDDFQTLVSDLPVPLQVEQFLVVMALWSRGRLAPSQRHSYGPLSLRVVTRQARRERTG
ncbi:MAG: hypothetical protein M0Z54_15995 [Thermaerobacter sp.]|nr:hypothetical protein [Thermaerobacter sp.]